MNTLLIQFPDPGGTVLQIDSKIASVRNRSAAAESQHPGIMISGHDLMDPVPVNPRLAGNVLLMLLFPGKHVRTLTASSSSMV